MKPAPRALFVTLLLAAAGLGFYARRERTRQAVQRRTLVEKIAAARATLERTQRERATAERELVILRRTAKDAEARATVVRTETPSNSAVTGWEQKVATLRSLLVLHPQWSIPEIGLLSPDEFIFFARDAQLDGEEAQRKALRDLRALAKRKLAPQFRDALDKYAMASGGRLPAEIHELTSYLESPLPEAVLNRYALTGKATVSADRADNWLLYERTPVDELYDTRNVLGGRFSGQITTNPAIYVISRALVAHADANPGRKPAEPAELGPYLEVPLDAPTLDRYFNQWLKQPANFGINSFLGRGGISYPPIGMPREAVK